MHLSCVGNGAWPWECTGEQERQGPCPQGAYNQAFFTLCFSNPAKEISELIISGIMMVLWRTLSPIHHLTSPRWSLGVSGWKCWDAGSCSLGCLAFVSCQMLSLIEARQSWFVNPEANKGNLSCWRQDPSSSIPWGRLFTPLMVVFRAVEASLLNTTSFSHAYLTFSVRHNHFASVSLTSSSVPCK